MSAQNQSQPAADVPANSTLKPLKLHETPSHPVPANIAAARRPILPSHAADTAPHASHHQPVKTQA